MTKYYKLIRDKIPEIINASGKDFYAVNIDDQKVYKETLKFKLIEEVKELFLTKNKDDLAEEIADVYEVLEALINAYNLDKQTVNKIKINKANKKGSFAQKIKLIEIKEEIFGVNNLPKKEQNLINQLENYLQHITPEKANLIDQNSSDLTNLIQEINQEQPNIFRLKIPKQWGGIEISQLGFCLWQTIISKYSGALAFLQTQHHSAVSMLSQSKNQILQEKYLLDILNQNKLYGVGFSHLRRQGKPTIKAIPVDGGYQLTGNIPWITGYGFFSDVIIGAILPTGEEFYGIIPLVNQQKNQCTLELSKPLKLSTFNSTNTVIAKLNKWFISYEDVVMIKPPLSIHQRDKQNILQHSFFALGCCQKALEICQNNAENLNLNGVNQGINYLVAEFENLWQKIFIAITDLHQSPEDKLRLRVHTINLLYRCVSSAVMTTKGNSNIVNNPASRLYREALVYGISGQTTSLLEEYFLLSV